MIFRWRIKTFLDWACSSAIPLSLDSPKEAVQRLSALDDALMGKRIVYLGEEDHWVHEKSSYRMLLLRYLLSQGFTVLGEELGWSDGLRTDQYLKTGDTSFLERIATYGYKGDRRKDRDELPQGILKASTDDYPTEAFKAEQLRLVTMLRGLNENRPPEKRIRFFGFDINAAVGGGYADIQEQLRPFSSAEVVLRLLSKLDIVPRETYDKEILRLREALGLLASGRDNFVALMGKDRVRALEQNIQTVQKSLEYYKIANTAATYKELNPAMALRETLMVSHVEYILQTLGKNERLVLMGHNRHLSKNIFHIQNAGSCPPGGKLVPSLGTSLFQRYPSEIFSIWMLFESGQSSLPVKNLNSVYTYHPKRLNAVLSQVGDTFLLPIYNVDSRAHMLKRPMKITGIYNLPFRAALTEQADAVFFTRTVSKLRF